MPRDTRNLVHTKEITTDKGGLGVVSHTDLKEGESQVRHTTVGPLRYTKMGGKVFTESLATTTGETQIISENILGGGYGSPTPSESISIGNQTEFSDDDFFIYDEDNVSNILRFNLDSASGDRTLTIPDDSFTLFGADTAITLTDKIMDGSGCVWQGTNIAVAYGGTGVSTLADNSVLTGTGTSAVTAESNLTFSGSVLNVTGSVGIGTDLPENLLHIVDVEAATGKFYDTHSQLIVEDTDARLQIIGDYSGTNASALVLSNVNTADDNTDSWFLHHNGVTNSGRFSIGYNANQTANEDVITNKTLATDPFTILTSGNVGIGTSSPDYLLQVEKNNANAEINIKATGTGIFSALSFGDEDDDNIGQLRYDHNNNRFELNTNAGSSGDGITVNSSNYVGIGATSPQVLLDVAGSASSGKSLQLRSGDETTHSDSSQIIFSYDGRSYDATGYAHSIRTRHKAATAAGNSIDFWLWNPDTADASTLGDERVMQIEGSGRVGIGTTPDRTLDVSHASEPQIRLSCSTQYVDLQSDSSGDLTIDPNGNDIFIGGGAKIGTADYASQLTGWRITNPGDADFRYLFVDEMHAKSFIADLEQALAGGQIIAKSVAVLHTDYSLPAAGAYSNFTVKDLPSAPGMGVFVANDWIRFRLFTRPTSGDPSLTIADAWGQVTNYLDNGDGTQNWRFTRPADAYDGTASGTVSADSIVLDYGASGNGFYEVNAIDGAAAVNSPYSQIVTWAGSYGPGESGAQTVRTRFGNLGGLAIGATGEFGIVAGESLVANTGNYVKASSAGVHLQNCSLELHDGAATTIKLNHTLPALGIGTAASLTALPSSSEKGFWVGQQGTGNYDLFLGDESNTRLIFDDSAATLTIYTTDTVFTKYSGSSIAFHDGYTTKPKMTIGGGNISMFADNSTNQIAVWDNTTITLGGDTGDNSYTTVIAPSSITLYGNDANTKVSIGSNTVSVQADANDRVDISNTGMSVFSGSSTAQAIFGSTVQIGQDTNNQSRVVIGSTTMDFIVDTSGTDATVASFGANTTITGGTITIRNSTNNNDKVVLAEDSLKIYDNNTLTATFSEDITLTGGVINCGDEIFISAENANEGISDHAIRGVLVKTNALSSSSEEISGFYVSDSIGTSLHSWAYFGQIADGSSGQYQLAMQEGQYGGTTYLSLNTQTGLLVGNIGGEAKYGVECRVRANLMDLKSPTGGTGSVSATNGYAWLPGGLLMMWGQTIGPNDTNWENFADICGIEFPNNCFQVVACSGQSTAGSTNIDVYSISKTRFGCRHGGHERPARFIAIGN